MDNLKNQLESLGFKEKPKKGKKDERGRWKGKAKKRLLKSDFVFLEIRLLIKEAHEKFKGQKNSGKWFRRFLSPLYKIKGELEKGDGLSRREIRKLVKKLW